jgi:hypothetical protein
MKTRWLILALLFLASCSSEREPPITRTVTVSAAKLAEIRAAPKVVVYPKSGPSRFARLGGMEQDPWPPGVMLYTPDPYMEQLGFGEGHMIAKIDGKRVHEIFVPRWQKLRIRRPAGFDAGHYNDMLSYIFLEHQQKSMLLTVYVGVTMRAEEIPSYQPVMERWQVNFER